MRKPIKFLDLLQQIKNEELDNSNLKIEYLDKVFKYDQDDGMFINTLDNELSLSDIYSDVDLPDMTVVLLVDTDSTNNTESWKDNVVVDYIKKYIDMAIDLDLCQGSTDNLEEIKSTMSYYKKCIKDLGYDFGKLYEQYYNVVYNKRVTEQKKIELEEQRKDSIIKLLQLDWAKLVTIGDSTVCNMLVKIEEKINEICHILREDNK